MSSTSRHADGILPMLTLWQDVCPRLWGHGRSGKRRGKQCLVQGADSVKAWRMFREGNIVAASLGSVSDLANSCPAPRPIFRCKSQALGEGRAYSVAETSRRQIRLHRPQACAIGGTMASASTRERSRRHSVSRRCRPASGAVGVVGGCRLEDAMMGVVEQRQRAGQGRVNVGMRSGGDTVRMR